MQKHIVELSGGLGNQLFQYAFGIGLRQAGTLPVEFRSAVGRFGDPYKRNLELQSYGISESIETINLGIVKYFPEKFRRLQQFVDRIDTILRYRREERSMIYREKTPFHYSKEPANICKPCIFIGYWQNPKYFLDAANCIRNTITIHEYELSVYSKVILKEIQRPNAIAIHFRNYSRDDIRRFGRNVTPHPTLGLKYYAQAYNIFRERIPDPEVYVFRDLPSRDSDDFIQMCNRCCIVDSQKIESAIHENYIMSKSRNIIIANSTYSWWAAWLGEGGKKFVVAPRIWMNDSSSSDIYPPNWVTL
jgi:hypothetical protein